jgi:hypothetical protein
MELIGLAGGDDHRPGSRRAVVRIGRDRRGSRRRSDRARSGNRLWNGLRMHGARRVAGVPDTRNS